MFSGIVEEIGSIYQTELINEGVRFYVSCSKVNKDVRIGDSIAIDGVCQTIVGIDNDKLIFEAVGITLEKTTLGEIKPKDHVNLERSMLLGERINGHLVQGHVNGKGTVIECKPNYFRNENTNVKPNKAENKNWILTIKIPDQLKQYITLEGSIAINGVSLTIAEFKKTIVAFSIIPHTAAQTTLVNLISGSKVNIEVDMIEKYNKTLQAFSKNDINFQIPIKHNIKTALQHISTGGIIILTDQPDRENEGDFLMAAEFITSDAVNFMITHGRGLLCVPLTTERAKNLELEPMSENNNALHGTAFTVSVDYKIGTTTGTSASDRAATIKALSDNSISPKCFARPGHVFPITGDPGGVTSRQGHTEAAIELMKQSFCTPVAVICEIMSFNGTMANKKELEYLSKIYSLPMISVEEVILSQKERI